MMSRRQKSKQWILRRWRGDIPLSIALYRDMLIFGTLANAASAIGAFLAVNAGWPTWSVALVHFLPLPLNLLLFSAVEKARPRSYAAQALALAWITIATLL
jgi:hypothetical protein